MKDFIALMCERAEGEPPLWRAIVTAVAAVIVFWLFVVFIFSF